MSIFKKKKCFLKISRYHRKTCKMDPNFLCVEFSYAGMGKIHHTMYFEYLIQNTFI